jgi:acetaldehyde dehydrogenase (acetylating)
LSLRDRDLVSIQEARELVARASEAQKAFAKFSQEQVDAVVAACAEAATNAAEQLARVAVEETGYGNVPDKITKNRLGSVAVFRAIQGIKTVGVLSEDRAKGLLEVATPVGVVAAIIPSTNPTSTAIYKTLISVKAGNGIVMSPHPTAVRCICEAATVMAHAATRAGAPEGLIACCEHPTMPGTQELMRHRSVGVILATGGTGLVRAAYSSGKPAFGVGPGNVPAYIERTAYVPKAVADIIAGKTFDYGTICSAEQSIVADEAIREAVLEECRRQGAYFLSAEEARRLGELVIVPTTFTPNPKIVGRPAPMIAEMAGIKVPPGTRVLIAKLESVGREHPLSAEKLSPILAFYSVKDTSAAVELCTRLLEFGGLGHTIAIHSNNDKAIREFGQRVPAFRVCVNTSAVHGSIGYSTNLFPAMTLGCGALGGNITSDNISPLHLVNVKRIAWESRPVEHRTVPPEQRMLAAPPPDAEVAPIAAKAEAAAAQRAMLPAPSAAAAPSAPAAQAASAARAGVDRTMIARIVERAFIGRGIPRGGESKPAAQATGPQAGLTPGPTTAAPAVAAFVSETDVRLAITHQQKIHVGPKTIITPSARDLGLEYEVFVEAEVHPASPQSTSASSAKATHVDY